eukprot:787217-Amphidinium_carterae.1
MKALMERAVHNHKELLVRKAFGRLPKDACCHTMFLLNKRHGRASCVQGRSRGCACSCVSRVRVFSCAQDLGKKWVAKLVMQENVTIVMVNRDLANEAGHSPLPTALSIDLCCVHLQEEPETWDNSIDPEDPESLYVGSKVHSSRTCALSEAQ